MGPQKLDVGVMRRMGDRNDFIFVALLVAVLSLSGSLWLTLLVACAHRTLQSGEPAGVLLRHRGGWSIGCTMAIRRARAEQQLQKAVLDHLRWRAVRWRSMLFGSGQIRCHIRPAVRCK